MPPRSLLVVVAIAFVALPGTAVEPVVVYVNNDTGHFAIGLFGEAGIGSVEPGDPVPSTGLGEVNRRDYEVAVDQCHRHLAFSLQYAPDQAVVDQGSNSVALDYTFRVEAHGVGFHHVVNVSTPGDAYRLGTVPSAGTYHVSVQSRVGFDVDWTFTLRGLDVLRFAPTEWEPACAMVRITELEANPAGDDAGNEWLELQNEEFSDVDLSGWSLQTLGGVKETWTLPDGTVLEAGGFLVVNFTAGQFLDNEDEGVVFVNAWGIETDRTATLTDTRNDARTNQWVQDTGGSFGWVFETGTQGLPN